MPVRYLSGPQLAPLSSCPWLGWIPDDLPGLPDAGACPPRVDAGDRLRDGVRNAGGPRRLAGPDPPRAPCPGADTPGVALVRGRRTQAARRVPARAGAGARRAGCVVAAGLRRAPRRADRPPTGAGTFSNYSQTTRASAVEIRENPTLITDRLVRPLMRGLGTEAL